MTGITIINIVSALISVSAAVVVIAGRNATGQILELIVQRSREFRDLVARSDALREALERIHK